MELFTNLLIHRFVMSYGAKLIFGLSVLVPSIFTFFVPFAARTSYEWAIVIRILIGLTESASFPAIFQFFQNWVSDCIISPNSHSLILTHSLTHSLIVGAIRRENITNSIYVFRDLYGRNHRIFIVGNPCE